MEGETGDKHGIDFPEVQRSLLKVIREVNNNIVLVLNNGSALAISWEKKNIPAIIEAWYPGEEGFASYGKLFHERQNLPIF